MNNYFLKLLFSTAVSMVFIACGDESNNKSTEVKQQSLSIEYTSEIQDITSTIKASHIYSDLKTEGQSVIQCNYDSSKNLLVVQGTIAESVNNEVNTLAGTMNEIKITIESVDFEKNDENQVLELQQNYKDTEEIQINDIQNEVNLSSNEDSKCEFELSKKGRLLKINAVCENKSLNTFTNTDTLSSQADDVELIIKSSCYIREDSSIN